MDKGQEQRLLAEITLRRRTSPETIEKLLKGFHRVICAIFTLLADAFSDKVKQKN